MADFLQRSVWKKYLDILFTKVCIVMKENKEYRASFWGFFFSDITLVVVFGFFFATYNSVLGDILEWTNTDFLVYLILLILTGKIMWSFSLIFFGRFLLSGNLNNYLVRPVNSYFMTCLNNLKGATFPMFGLFLIFLFVIVLGQDYDFYFLSFLIFIFGACFYIMFINFFYSLSFFMKRGEFIATLITRNILFVVEEFTPKVFERMSFGFLFYLLPSAFYSFFVVESLRGDYSLFLRYLPYGFSLFFLVIVGTILLWHYGLKKYEGFG